MYGNGLHMQPPPVPVDEDSAQAWACIPVDDVGYIASAEMLDWPDAQLRDVVEAVSRIRYRGWRNHGGLWRSTLRMDDTRDMRVLDYGCGLGVEALQYALAGNDVWLADIVETNVRLAERVLRLFGHAPAGVTVLPERSGGSYGRLLLPREIEVVHCAGVLHHIRAPARVMARFAELMTPRGECRLMLYSDRGWRVAVGGDPPAGEAMDEQRRRFIDFFDGAFPWSDWYDAQRIEQRFGAWFSLIELNYLTPDGRYLAARLARRPSRG